MMKKDQKHGIRNDALKSFLNVNFELKSKC